MLRAPGARLSVASGSTSLLPVRDYSSKSQIPSSNMFWMKHQIEAKPNFHSHINQERVVAALALGSCVGCVIIPGNFVLDTACAITFIAHAFYGVEAMIGDYVPLVAPAVVAKVGVSYA
jgi:hypothetical protein